ncbi:uncharacterized protein LOC133180278 [Saccostrea echinata]|uniref:uncharacterized protein LOC133176527 n=1 Tax=Saccostrea echinata TaxID=191078 RepID=UPI002A81C846|nr:uncharacterized protein LOC133176527 [Saccostrea echinata]XP_061170805.1 uncharacterized protein LOC133180278 [Saccostrea echinata]
MLCKFWIQVLVAVSLLTVSFGQVSFSTSWGSGKRSSNTAPLVDDICLTKTDTKLLYDLMRVIQRQAERIIACSRNYDELKRTLSHIWRTNVISSTSYPLCNFKREYEKEEEQSLILRQILRIFYQKFYFQKQTFLEYLQAEQSGRWLCYFWKSSQLLSI